MKKLFLASIFICVLSPAVQGQRVYSLVPGVFVDSILETQPGASKIEFDEISGNLFYTTSGGDIYEVFDHLTGSAYDSLCYTSADHGITSLQGFCMRDSVMYLSGNNWGPTTSTGKVVKGVLQSNGTRVWTSIATTDPYPSASSGGDHGFTGVDLDPAGNYIYVSSGARTHLGEIRTNNGAWPGMREVPMTCKIFRFPVSATNIILPNDSALLDSSGYIFAYGTRNAYAMAWDQNDNLFAIDNSGERDDPEELNWLRQGKHYGYPWNMGGNLNPLMNSPYDASQDPLVNPNSFGYQQGWLADDPTFPPAPGGVSFTEPIRNYGISADFFRDSVTGTVKNASDEGTYLTTFTAHRSPLGLVIDRGGKIDGVYNHGAFVLSFMPGGDSSGYTPLSPWGGPCPFVDPSQELVHMQLSYNATIDNYTMTTSDVVTGFYTPVDAVLQDHFLWVIENNGDIWKVEFPPASGTDEINSKPPLRVYPNPVMGTAAIRLGDYAKDGCDALIYNSIGNLIMSVTGIKQENYTFHTDGLPSGIYFVQLIQENRIRAHQRFNIIQFGN